MRLRRGHLEAAKPGYVRRYAAWAHGNGCQDLKEHATMDLKWLIDRLCLNGYAVDYRMVSGGWPR